MMIFYLESQRDLEEVLQLLHTRNNKLLELLQNAKITPPSFVVPKAYTYLGGQVNLSENNCNAINIKTCGRPGKYSQKITRKKAKVVKKNGKKVIFFLKIIVTNLK